MNNFSQVTFLLLDLFRKCHPAKVAKSRKYPKMNKWEHCKSSSIVKWHLGFLIILTFRPFPPLPPLREPPLPSKTCKTTFFVANLFQKKIRAKEKVTNRGISKAIYGIDKQPHLKRQNAASCKLKGLTNLFSHCLSKSTQNQ